MISFQKVTLGFGPHLLLRDASFEVRAGDIFALVGPSGAGKSTILKSMVGLVPLRHGHITVGGYKVGEDLSSAYYRQMGFLFQEGALFGGLTVLENIAYPLEKLLGFNEKDAKDLAFLKLLLVGIEARVGSLLPAEISGGMKKRVALARALALDPPIVLLDEPTAGLDPEASHAFDVLIADLKMALNLTVLMVTHDLDSLAFLKPQIGLLAEEKVVSGSLESLLASQLPEARDYFHSYRAERSFLSFPPQCP